MKEIQEILDKIEELGWVITDEGNNYLLSKFSPAGQDFNVIVTKSDDVNKFIENIYEAYENYDVSEEVRLWIDDFGHGKNGAPYEIKDLVEDMEWCKQAIYDLWHELSGNRKKLTKLFEELNTSITPSEDFSKDLEITKEVVDKEVPKRPIEDFEEEGCYHEGEYERVYFHLCPSCGEEVYKTYNKNYCGNCRQRLDWSKEE